jgi:hypothetical protein
MVRRTYSEIAQEYDEIAHEYRDSKLLPFRDFVESFSLSDSSAISRVGPFSTWLAGKGIIRVGSSRLVRRTSMALTFHRR